MFDGKAYGEGIVDIVRSYCEREIAPLKAENESLKLRLAALEDRPPPAKGEPGEKGERGEDAVSPDLATIVGAFRPVAEELIAAAAAKAVAELPTPEKGEPGERGEKGEAGNNGANGKDGAGVVDGFLNREGHLIATLSDGTTRDFGEVIGKDGRDGEPGKDGRDGFGFDDMDVCVLGDDRTIELSFRRGDDEKAFTLKWPTVIDRGPFKIDREIPYEAGDGVTWGGQFYICNEQTNEKPDQSKDGKPWRLAVRKGRDGKDAKIG